VRSYVTNPTTIKAITDIPAKTPRPIGRTDNFFPGTWKAAAESDGCSAAAADPGGLDEFAFTSGAVVPEGEGVEDWLVGVFVAGLAEDVVVDEEVAAVVVVPL